VIQLFNLVVAAAFENILKTIGTFITCPTYNVGKQAVKG
jgi:hypothetical protein